MNDFQVRKSSAEQEYEAQFADQLNRCGKKGIITIR
jgi:hypothetical protein